MQVKFDTYGNDKQLLAAKYWADKSTKILTYGGSKGSGKSHLGCSLILGNALMFPGTRYFIARKTLADLVKHTMSSIIKVLDDWKIPKSGYKYNGQVYGLFFPNGSRVDLIGAKYLPSDPDYHRLGSTQYTQGWIEEGGEFDWEAVENLLASVGRWKNPDYGLLGKVLITCNPAKNFLYDYYKRNKLGKLEDHEKFIQALPRDNKTQPGYEEHLRKTIKNKNAIERLVEGNWEYDSDPSALIDYEAISNIFTNDFESLSGKSAITADVARRGSDLAVILLWNGFRVEKICIFETSDIPDIVDLIKEWESVYSVPRSRVVIDDDGVGGGVTDYLKGCKPFVNNSSVIETVKGEKENYGILKDQCYFKLADRINKNGVYIKCPDLDIQTKIKTDLEWVKDATYGEENKKRVLSKKQVKQILKRSTDFSDALMMREYLELKPAVRLDQVKIFRPKQRVF